jgi:Flp pilus assembly protein TadG
VSAQPRRGRHGERGQGTVEFALAAFFALILMFGTIDFGRAMFTYDNLANLSRLGARYAIVHGSVCSTSGCPTSATAIQTYVRGLSTGDDASHITVTTTWGPSGTCSATAQNAGCWVNVSVSYPFHYALEWGTVTLTGSSQMIISQ